MKPASDNPSQLILVTVVPPPRTLLFGSPKEIVGESCVFGNERDSKFTFVCVLDHGFVWHLHLDGFGSETLVLDVRGSDWKEMTCFGVDHNLFEFLEIWRSWWWLRFG